MKRIHAILIIFCAVVSIIIIGLYLLVATKEAHEAPQFPVGGLSNSTMTLYYGETCPHCKIVNDWLATHNSNGRLIIEHKEVYSNPVNAEALGAAATVCGLPDDSIGVPFLAVNGQCIVGDEPIIAYLNTQLVATS